MNILPTIEEIRQALASSDTVEGLIYSLLRNHAAPLKGPYTVVSVLNDSKQHIARCIAPGFDEEFLQFLENVKVGPEGTTAAVSIYRNSPVYVSHIGNTTQYWEDLASTWFGIWAAWSVPLYKSRNEIYGALTFYFTVPQEAGPPYMEAFEALADILSSAINAYTS